MTIYFLHAPVLGLVKIGFTASADRIEKRIHAARHRTGVESFLLGARDGSKRDESDLHMRHALAWHLGEWFQDTAAIRASALSMDYVGPDAVDPAEVRNWLRSWSMSWAEIGRVAGIGMGCLAVFADSGRLPRTRQSVALGRAYLLLEKCQADVRLPLGPSVCVPFVKLHFGTA